jgi:SNF2 family DNA or RNA helicase/DNA-directed RNA polymerase subunit RPC12/RpoP
MQIGEFLQRYGRDLFRATEAKLPPLVQEPRLTWQGGRKPMGAQALAITGIAEALRRHGVGILAAEMGTGKTHMAIRAALELDPKGAFLVMCPPHLVEKWAREVREEGAHAVILRERQDLEALPHAPRPLFAVLSREKAKLGPGWEPAVAYRSALKREEGRKARVEVPVCPRCGHPVGRLPKTRRTACPRCGEPLWQVRPPRREAMAHAIRRLLPKGFFSLLLLDEAHEYKGADSAQGLTAAGLISWTGKVLLLTGTLFGGYASSIYHLLARAVPGFREEFPTEASFVARYGLFKRVRRERVEGGYGRYTRRRETRTETYERPGISPLLLTHLVDKAAFVRLPEVAEALPPYGEEVVLLDMDEEHREAYEAFARGLSGVAGRSLKARRFLGALVQAGLQVPDTPWQPEAVVDPETGNTVARFVPLSPDYRHAKERRLIALLAAEKLKGRRAIVYVQGTERRDQLARLAGILEAEGFKPIVLRADTVRPEEREAWLKAQVEKGGDVLLCHPRVVQTGLDLVDFPTVVFYQPEYSVYTLRQAARRSWRIGQKEPVRVVYMAYRGTLQEAALVLIAQKARSSLALEGELVEGGLVSAAEEDPTVALAKALAGAVRLTWEGEGVGLEAAVHLGEGGPKAATGKAAGRAKAPALPTLPEGRWVRTRRGRVFLPPGQPVLFAEVL